jgi:hypothetical protein
VEQEQQQLQRCWLPVLELQNLSILTFLGWMAVEVKNKREFFARARN